MKCIKILVGDISPAGDRTMEEFLRDAEARTPFGQLVIALADEREWSVNYSFSAHIRGNKSSLLISHPTFFPNRANALVFTAKDSGNPSVRCVADAVRAHLLELKTNLQDKIKKIKNEISGLGGAADRIVIARARAAIIAAFPDAGEIEYILCLADCPEFYAFCLGTSGFTYVARVINNEISGTVRLQFGRYAWQELADTERRRIFLSEMERQSTTGVVYASTVELVGA